jgi:hypothetical protein
MSPSEYANRMKTFLLCTTAFALSLQGRVQDLKKLAQKAFTKQRALEFDYTEREHGRIHLVPDPFLQYMQARIQGL